MQRRVAAESIFNAHAGSAQLRASGPATTYVGIPVGTVYCNLALLVLQYYTAQSIVSILIIPVVHSTGYGSGILVYRFWGRISINDVFSRVCAHSSRIRALVDVEYAPIRRLCIALYCSVCSVLHCIHLVFNRITLYSLILNTQVQCIGINHLVFQ